MSGELLMLISHGIPLIQASKLHPKPPWGTLTKLQALTNHFNTSIFYDIESN